MAKERLLVLLFLLSGYPRAVNALIYTLQMLHLLPTYLGPIAFYQFSLIGHFSGAVIFIWLAGIPDALGSPAAGWMFMVLIAVFTTDIRNYLRSGRFILGGNGTDYHHKRIDIDLRLLPAPSRHSGFPSRSL